MKISIRIESLKCQEGGSNKGYQIALIRVGTAAPFICKVYGALNLPNRYEIMTGDAEDNFYSTVKSKLKKYNRHNPADEYHHEVVNEVGLKAAEPWVNGVFKNHGPWAIEASEKLKITLEPLWAHIEKLAQGQDMAPSVEDLFRNKKQREEAEDLRRRLEEETRNMDNWGSF